MGDKLANVLIVFMMVIILGLGGLYYVKVTGSNSYSPGNSLSYSEQAEGYPNAMTTNANTVNGNSEDNRVTIGGVSDDNLNLYNQNANQPGYRFNNRYYYNSLTEYSKVIYDAIVNNIDNLKTGNYVINIDYDFGGLLSNANGQEALHSYYDDAVDRKSVV